MTQAAEKMLPRTVFDALKNEVGHARMAKAIMAHVADFSRTRRHSEFFVKQINKLEEIVSNLKT